MTPDPEFEDIDELYPDDEHDEFEEAMQNCCGHFDGGYFVCGAAGSEDCDWECPFSRDIGLTAKEIEAREDAEIDAALRADREAKGSTEYDSWCHDIVESPR